MKKGLYTIVAVVMAALLMMTSSGSAVSALTTLTGDAVIDIKDTYFLTELKNKNIDLNGDGKISVKEMESLTYLSLYNWQITDISGIEYAKNLTSLYLSGVKLSDLSFTKNMTKLTSLYIYNNYSTNTNTLDISAIGGLTELTNLSLCNSIISDISQLKYLTKLTSLSLNNSSISDISILKDLTNLNSLYLYSNNISDISPLKSLTNLRNLSLDYNEITDISSLSGLVNLNSVYVGNNQISDISPLKNLSNLTSLSLYGNNVSDADMFALARISYEQMFKGREYNSGVLPNGILSGFTLSSDNTDILKIEGSTITALKEGEATIKLQYNGLSKSFKVKVNGIDANQPLETSTIVTTEFNHNAALNSKGELWNLADNGPKVVMNNVKKYVAYVAYVVYEGERGSTIRDKLAIDNNNTLWSWGDDKNTENGTMAFQDNKKEMENVKAVDARYAVTYSNQLFDYCTDEPKLLDNVKQLKRISESYDSGYTKINIGTEVLDLYGNLWTRRDVKLGDTTKAFKQVASGVKELTDSNGYIKDDGSYWQWNGVTTGDLVFNKSADNVSSVKDGFIVKTDKTTVISPYDGSIILTTGLKDVKRYGYYSENYGASYLVDENNTLWRYTGSAISKISDGFKEFTENGFIKADETICDYSNNLIDYVKKINYYPGDITLGKDNTLYMSGIKILTNVNNICRSTSYPTSYYAIRTDGTIWEVGDMIPTKVANIDYDVNHDGLIDIIDMANIGSKYNVISTAANYNKECDFNKDNIIDIYDIVSFSKKLRGPMGPMGPI